MRVNGVLTALRSVIQKFDASVCARVSGGAVRHQQAPYRCGLNRRQRWARLARSLRQNGSRDATSLELRDDMPLMLAGNRQGKVNLPDL
jgi:hypothetical protein